MWTTLWGTLIFAFATFLVGCSLNPTARGDLFGSTNRNDSSAQPSAIEINDRFEMLDADKNGVVSKQEAEKFPRLYAVFDRYNADRDGALNWNEFTAVMLSRISMRN
jgi:Ca2+-binding EF-hand superfamily protein